MTTDRHEQARAEAERRYPGGQRRFTEANLQAAFRQGWLAADENHPAVEALARVRGLHRKFGLYELEDSCTNTSEEHRQERHHEASDEVGDLQRRLDDPLAEEEVHDTVRPRTYELLPIGPDSVRVTDISSTGRWMIHRHDADPEHRHLHVRMAAAWFANSPAGTD